LSEKEKEDVIRKIRERKLEAAPPEKRLPFLKRWMYIEAVEDLQPATIEEIVKRVQGNPRGVKAFLRKLEKKGELKVVVSRGKEYYLTTEYYESLRGKKK